MGILCNHLVIWMLIFIFGASVGSFLNVLIYRIPKGKSIVYPPSACPSCGAKIKYWQNIPIVSWFFLKGRCYYCGEKISVQYPLVEFLTAMLALTVFFINGCNVYSFIIFFVFSLFLALSVIDAELLHIPASLVFLTVVLAVFSGPDWFENILGVVLGILTMLMIKALLYFVEGKDEFGFLTNADVLLLGSTAGLVGYEGFLFVSFFAFLFRYLLFYCAYKRKQIKRDLSPLFYYKIYNDLLAERFFGLIPYIFIFTLIVWIYKYL